ncbi:MAG: serine acetyltransferase [Spirochaetales bacterium]|nr:serine acetyltransferase [Spirochaetales bacterium]
MPSIQDLSEAVDSLRSVLFPGYFRDSELRPDTLPYYTGAVLSQAARLLQDQIKRGFCFSCDREQGCTFCEDAAVTITGRFMKRLPAIRELLASDARAAFEGDPAAKSIGEAIFCYPSITAVTNYRIAHELYLLQVPLIPRIITEMAHARTGIDIHPGATLGRRFFIDHGTGTVIGETCVIGENVRLYQNVTLGAKSFPLDEAGKPIKGIPRHPIVEDDVIIYAGATILGRVTLGRGSEIGGNVWIVEDIPPYSKIRLGGDSRELSRTYHKNSDSGIRNSVSEKEV